MQRLPVMALMLSFALATPGVAQNTADVSPQTKRYGPVLEPSTQVLPRRPRDLYELGEVAAPPSVSGNRFVADEQIGPNAVVGLGIFQVIKEPKRPDSIDRQPSVRSRIAAAGLSIGF